MRLLRVLSVIWCITHASAASVTLTVSNSGSALTDFQQKFTLAAFGTLGGNFNTMRVYAGGTCCSQTPLPQWIEDPTVSTNAVVWVKIPSLTNNMLLTVIDGNSTRLVW